MTAKLTFGAWIQASGWGTALSNVATGSDTTSGAVDNSAQRSEAMDVYLNHDKGTAAGTGAIEIWILPEVNGNYTDTPLLTGGRYVGAVNTAAETTLRRQMLPRVHDLPDKFKFYLYNGGGSNTSTNTDLRYRFVDEADV